MSSDWKPRKAGKLPPSSKYEVGYGKPPAETRFKPGESGNPRGGPKGSRNRSPYPRQDDLRSIFRQEANRLVPINEGGKTVTIVVGVRQRLRTGQAEFLAALEFSLPPELVIE